LVPPFIYVGINVTHQVQSSIVHGSRLTDEKCDPAAGEIPLSAGNVEP